MTLFTGIVLYILIWWTALFAVLPLGVRPHGDRSLGTAGSAPEDPRIKRKFLITSLVSAVIWLGVYGLIRAGALDFREMAREMAQESRADGGQDPADVLEKAGEKAKTGDSQGP